MRLNYAAGLNGPSRECGYKAGTAAGKPVENKGQNER